MTAPGGIPPYGEWPARNARMGEVALAWAMLAVKGVGGDHVVLIGDCLPGSYQGPYDCAADAGGYRWSFRGSVFDRTPRDAGRVRVWIRSEGDVSAGPIAGPGN